MELVEAKEWLQDAAEKTKDAAKATREATEGEEEEELESEYERKMEQLQNQYRKQVLNSIFHELDNQNWVKAQSLAKEEADLEGGWGEFIQEYISIRLKQGQKDLAIVRYQLNQAENFIEQAENAGTVATLKPLLNQAMTRYKKIEKDELLEIQRQIGAAEQAAKHYGDSLEKHHKIFSLEHAKVNQLDEDIREAEEDLRDVVEKLKSNK